MAHAPKAAGGATRPLDDAPEGDHGDDAGDVWTQGLLEVAARERPAYMAATPYPHAELHGLIPDRVLATVAAEIGDISRNGWERWSDARQVKRESHDASQFGPATRRVLDELNAPPFLAFLESLTGIPCLIADDTRTWAGIHETPEGGSTKIHIDFTRHPVTNLHHRVNVLVYLNEPWNDDWGGFLELWPRDMSAAGRRIRPHRGTVVIFATHDGTYHGLPDPVACGEGGSRISLASYYYTKDRPAGEVKADHTAVYAARPQDPPSIAGAPLSARVVGKLPRPVRNALRSLRRRGAHLRE